MPKVLIDEKLYKEMEITKSWVYHPKYFFAL
jgi:hypothetical protein